MPVQGNSFGESLEGVNRGGDLDPLGEFQLGVGDQIKSEQHRHPVGEHQARGGSHPDGVREKPLQSAETRQLILSQTNKHTDRICTHRTTEIKKKKGVSFAFDLRMFDTVYCCDVRGKKENKPKHIEISPS